MTFVVVADYRKNSAVLGTNVRLSLSPISSGQSANGFCGFQYKQGVPIEVAPFAYAKLLQNLHTLGSPQAHLRMAKAKAGPVVSDNGNFIIDAPFEPGYYMDPYGVSSFSPDYSRDGLCHVSRSLH